MGKCSRHSIDFFGSKGYADTVISVADFGLKPDTRENAVAYVQKAIEACRGKEPVTLVFPEGRYDFWPQYAHEKNYYETNTYDVFPKRLAMLFEGLHNITVDGNGSQFVMHDRIQPITVENCDGVTLKNFSIDWDIPLTAQARVTKVGSDFSRSKSMSSNLPISLKTASWYSWVKAGKVH